MSISPAFWTSLSVVDQSVPNHHDVVQLAISILLSITFVTAVALMLAVSIGELPLNCAIVDAMTKAKTQNLN